MASPTTASAAGGRWGRRRAPASSQNHRNRAASFKGILSLMKIRPLYDRVVIRRQDEEEKTAGGILLPSNAQEKPNQGEVIAVGDGAVQDDGSKRSLEVKVGDRVVFGQYAGSNTVRTEDEEELIIMREDEIYAVLES